MRTPFLVVRVLVLILAGLCLVGCPSKSEPLGREKPLRLAFITCAVNGKFFGPVKKGMADAGQMMGVQCDFLGTEGVDVAAQAQMVRQAVADGYDGIAVNIIDPEAFDAVIAEAVDQGVPVVGFNVDDHATPNARLSSVNQRLYDALYRDVYLKMYKKLKPFYEKIRAITGYPR